MGRDVSLSRAFRRSRRFKYAAAELGGRVHRLRKENEWTLEKASDRMGLDFRHLQQIEAGTVNVTLATILRICDAFKVYPWAILPGMRSTKPKLGVDPPHRILRVAAIRGLDPPGMERDSDPGHFLENPIARPPAAETTELKKRVGSTIQKFRKERNLTQVKLAAAMTMSVKYVQMVEGGNQNLSLESLVKFARFFGIDPWELLLLASR